ncbi:hypothetical protein B0G77_7104 [Paraburkholderia sp. BL10I2N1]|nr:hypothetical protein B0G77_7104 [Paraburkholderia sp. BL10I2N1]
MRQSGAPLDATATHASLRVGRNESCWGTRLPSTNLPEQSFAPGVPVAREGDPHKTTRTQAHMSFLPQRNRYFGSTATDASLVNSRNVSDSCRYRRTVLSVWPRYPIERS